MNYFIIIIMLLSCQIHNAAITFINDSPQTIFITDHLSYATLLEPKNSYILNSHLIDTFYTYAQTPIKNHDFTLTYQIKIIAPHHQQHSISYQDIITNNINTQLLSVTPQSKLFFEKQKEKYAQQNQQKNSYAHPQTNKNHAHPHEQTLNALISQVQKIQQDSLNIGVPSVQAKPTPHHHAPYRPPTKHAHSSSSKDKKTNE